MDPTVQFFAKLKKVAVTLETETAKLQHAFDNRHNDDDSDKEARAMRAYHELNRDVGNLKGEIQKQLAEQKEQMFKVSDFIKACRVMQEKVSTDIQVLKEHCQKYGYQPPQDTQRKASTTEQESDPEDEVEEENEIKSAEAEEGSQDEEAGGERPLTPPTGGLPPDPDVLRTPQLSDFGLSEMQMKRYLAGSDWCSEMPPMPEISLPQPSLNTPEPPPMPVTPKCALRMDDTELMTPQMQAFGISEHTMCLINDFTMDLLQKNVEKPQRPPQDIPVPPVNSLMECFQTNDNLQSPEPPVLCNPGFKIKKSKSQCSPPAQSKGHPEPHSPPGKPPGTPEIPAFQTPYLKQLVSTKKGAKPPGPINRQADDDSQFFELPLSARNGSTSSKRIWEYDVPEISIPGMDDRQMPEMPNLESVLANSLQSRSAKLQKSSQHANLRTEPVVHSLELDGPTQEFSFRTPRLRKDFEEPSTPEMPDLSSVTQDICKLVSQAHSKKTAVAVIQPNVKADKENYSTFPTAVSVPVISESEFQSLPSYLRVMTLNSLNQAIHNINQFMAGCPGEKTEFQMEELRRITNVGAKTPVYILCLTELKRLTHAGGTKNASVYKLNTHN